MYDVKDLLEIANYVTVVDGIYGSIPMARSAAPTHSRRVEAAVLSAERSLYEVSGVGSEHVG